MWEARAEQDRAADLLAWAVAHAAPGADVYRNIADQLVVVIDDTGAGLPDVPPELVCRPPHVWRFERVPR